MVNGIPDIKRAAYKTPQTLLDLVESSTVMHEIASVMLDSTEMLFENIPNGKKLNSDDLTLFADRVSTVIAIIDLIIETYGNIDSTKQHTIDLLESAKYNLEDMYLYCVVNVSILNQIRNCESKDGVTLASLKKLLQSDTQFANEYEYA